MTSGTTVTFEAGVIADCMKKAARVAPAKVGPSFDKAAGIVLDIAPGTDAPCVVRATDTDIFYMEMLNILNAEGDKTRWRLPSKILEKVIGTIPAVAGKTVKFAHKGGEREPVVISSGRMTVKLQLIDNPYYPEWDPTSGVDLKPASNFGGAITRVEWATAKSGPSPLDGIHLNGEYAIATDRFKICRVPCAIDLPSGPVTIPSRGIGPLLKQMGDVLVGMDDTLFVAMPDDYTQIKSTVLGLDHPADRLDRVMDRENEEKVTFDRNDLITKVNNAVEFRGVDRIPVVNLYIGRGELAVYMNNEEIGLFGDVIELPGQADHQRTQLRFTPEALLGALNNSPTPVVTFEYNPSNIKLPVKIGAQDYEAWVAVRSEVTPSATAN